MKRLLLLLAAGALSRPAWAEGGHMYPPEGVIALWLFAMGLGIPAVLAGLALGLVRLVRPKQSPRLTLAFWAAWLTWMAGMVALLLGFIWGLSEEHAIILAGLLSFGAALVAAFRPRASKSLGSS